MAPPILKCITKTEREKDGFKSFNEWIHHYNHEYIGCNIHTNVKNYTGKATPANLTLLEQKQMKSLKSFLEAMRF